MAHEKSPSGAFEAALLNVRDAVANQSLLASNVRQFLEASLQKSIEEFYAGIR